VKIGIAAAIIAALVSSSASAHQEAIFGAQSSLTIE
jgi:hypothetical protein